MADILATAAFVLGPEDGLELIERYEKTEVYIVDDAGEIIMSPGFHDKRAR